MLQYLSFRDKNEFKFSILKSFEALPMHRVVSSTILRANKCQAIAHRFAHRLNTYVQRYLSEAPVQSYVLNPANKASIPAKLGQVSSRGLVVCVLLFLESWHLIVSTSSQLMVYNMYLEEHL